MKHNEFVIGLNFKCGERRRRCTDIGTRVIVAIPTDYADITRASSTREVIETGNRALTEKDLAGPPYFLAESVFDENDIIACKKI